MEASQEQSFNQPGCTVHVIETEKYKTNTVIVKMRSRLDRETVTMRALLPHVLQSGTENAPSATAFRTALDELYGAHFFVDSAKKGDDHVLTFTIEVANEKYLHGASDLFDQALNVMSDVLFRPYLKEAVFPDSTVKQEKRSLQQRIRSIYDDKTRYASVKLVEEMYKEDPYALPAGGLLEQVEPISPQSLYHYYKKTLAEDTIDIFVIGNVDPQNAAAKIESYFPFEKRSKSLKPKNTSVQVEDIRVIHEKQDLNQGKLNIGCRTSIRYADPQFAALQVFNGVFGGFAHSKLFMNVREKESLAYYAASRLDSHKGFLMMLAGIDQKNYDKTVKIMKEQLNEVKEGNISDLEMDQTKALLKNQLKESADTARGMVELKYHNIAAGVDRPIDELIQAIDAVTKEETAAAAKTVVVDTVYFLSGKEEQG
ncbi:EF-P 5-aminopentanol modification-associated protein YfmF [Domibacillus epiphyticus]|uniref:Peptidase M16 n=1 Tax=Domibacillus epiphyticus TaxID=1714355 RepID=A0A1V2ACD1_9BACI|nr:pitrilysin family protein [Domibacillus epiphyticus]OMP68656.1 peptidase M16 [Domibacillus epiphyticus]